MHRSIKLFLTFMVVAMPAGAQSVINTFAGGGPTGGPATSAAIGQPRGLARDNSGNLYVAADSAQRVFRVDPAGTISVFAGTGGQGFSGDGGSATDATLRFPQGVAVDLFGNVFIADQGNHRIRRVDGVTGIITTVAGTGVGTFSGEGGAATSAGIRNPFGVAVDSGNNLLIADTNNSRIRRVAAGADGMVTGSADETITTVAGNGAFGFSGDGGPATSAALNSPRGMSSDALGNIYVVDFSNNRVRRVNAITGTIQTVAGVGFTGFNGDNIPAINATMNPNAAVVDNAGNLFISDQNNRVRRVNLNTGIITTVAGGGAGSGDGVPAKSIFLQFPSAVVLDGQGNLYVSEVVASKVRRVEAGSDGVVTGLADEIISTVAGNGFAAFGGDGGNASSASLSNPIAMAFDNAGNAFIADSNNHVVRRVDGATGTISTVAGIPRVSGPGPENVPATQSAVERPGALVFDASGNLFIADSRNRVRRVSTGADGLVTGALDEIITTVVGGGIISPGDGLPATSAVIGNSLGLAFDAQGHLFVSDSGRNTVRRVQPGVDGIITGAPDEIISTVVGGTIGFVDNVPATTARLNGPHAIAFDADGNLLIADVFNNRIRRVLAGADGLIRGALDEIISTVVGSGTFGFAGDGLPATAPTVATGFPRGLALGVGGHLFLSDGNNNRIRRVDAGSDGRITGAADEILTTVVGSGGFGLAGDGLPASDPAVRLAAPFGIAFNSLGQLFIADLSNNRVRRVTASDTTAPVITPSVSGTLGNNGWYTSDVTVSWTVSDPESAITSSSGCGSTTVMTDTSGTTFTCNATSAGGTASQSVTIKRDATPPTIQATITPGSPAESGWYNIATGAPTVSFSCQDDTAGLAGPCPSPILLGEGADQSVSGSVTDQAGNPASVTVENLGVDLTAPTVAVTTPPDGATYVLNALVAANYTCMDGLSGMETCAGPVANGANISTAPVGSKSFTVNATDMAGNPASVIRNYVVQYNFVGFLQPVDNLPVINQAKAGRTIPVKWQLTDANGAYVSDLGSLASLLSGPIGCDTAPTAIVEEQLSSPGSTVFRYDATSNQFIYNWQSASSWRGCRLLQVTLSDGTQHWAKFNFK